MNHGNFPDHPRDAGSIRFANQIDASKIAPPAVFRSVFRP